MNFVNHTYDVVIVGAGIAGCATAMFIKKYAPSASVVMIDNKKESLDKSAARIGETIPPQSSQLLQHLGVWDTFLSKTFLRSYGTSAAWGVDDLYTNEYMFSANGYGWHLDRLAFDEMMVDSCKERGIEVLHETKIINCNRENNTWLLTLYNKEVITTINTKFIVDATGKQAAIAKILGAKKQKHDQMIAAYMHFDHSGLQSKYGEGTIVESCPHGWWYSACLPDNRMVVSFMTDADIAQKLYIMKGDGFQSLLNETRFTKERVSYSKALSSVNAVAAQSHILSEISGEAWLAVGDAASAYDPISSMGILKSMALSQYAAYATIDYIKGISNGLAKYEKIVKADYKAYETKRNEYYDLEKRYSSYLFWNRRQQNIIH